MKKKLMLSRKNKIIAGVCGGVAEYFNIDPTIVRLVWAVLALASWFWPAVVIYVVCWAILPADK